MNILWLSMVGGAICCLIGVLLVMAPQVVHQLNQKTSSPILRLDLLVKYHRITGFLLLAVGVYLLSSAR